MEIYEHEVHRYKVFCSTEGCLNPGGGHKSTYRNVKDFSEESRLKAIKAIQKGVRISATHQNPTQGQWKKTSKGWLCPECK